MPIPLHPTLTRRAGLSRREVLLRGSAAGVLGLAAMPGRALAAPNANGAIVVGSSLPLTGISSGAGKQYQDGLQAAFGAVNKAGGIGGRKLEAIFLDDGYDAKRTVDNVARLTETHEALALVNLFGTANTLAVMPYVDKMRVPVVGCVTGAAPTRRADERYFFFVRPTYQDESKRLVKQITSFGLNNIAIVYLDNAYGKEVVQTMSQELIAAKEAVAGTVALPLTPGGAEAAATAVAALNPAAVLMATTGSVAADFVLAFRAKKPQTPLSGLSVSIMPPEFGRLGKVSSGVALISVFPDVMSPKRPVARTFQNAMQAAGVSTYSSTTFEGWLYAQMAIEGIRTAGRDPTRESVRNSLAGMRNFSVGDFNVGFADKPPYVGSSYMDLTVYGNDFRPVG